MEWLPMWGRLRAGRESHKGSTSSVLKATSQPEHNFYPKPLDPDKVEIRIIKLLRGRYASKIQLQLKTVPLQDAGKYHALSYCWRSYPGTGTISVDGHDGFEVTENLYRALRRLRQRCVRRLWIDAICVNQKDDREKEWQIGLMKSIYGGAYSVKIWIGDSMSISRGYLAKFVLSLSRVAPPRPPLPPDAESHRHRLARELIRKELQIILKDATNLWWERIWVWHYD